MNSETIDARLRERLDPHVNALVDGSSTEYDILPAVLSSILNKQSSLSNNQTDLANLVHSQSGELKVSRESSQETLIEITNAISDLRVSQSDLIDIKFGDLKLQQDTSFQEVSNALNELRISQSYLADVKFGDLKLQHDASFQEVSDALTGLNGLISGLLKQQNSLESALLLAQKDVCQFERFLYQI